MPMISIDGKPVECPEGITILEAADSAGIYIPRLCHHPDLSPAGEVILAEAVFQGNEKIIGENPGSKAGDDAHCNLCLVDIGNGTGPVKSCNTLIEDGMSVQTATPEAINLRKQALSKILSDHPHACLTCAQKEGCSRTQCSSNVPVEERCCILLGNCELEKVSDFIGIPGDTPKYVPQNRPVIKDDPLFDRDFNLCIGCLRCVRACSDLRGADVLGAVLKKDRDRVGTIKGPALKEAECQFCGACVEVCPTGALMDKEDVPGVRKDAPLPCADSCPAGIDIPRYVQLIAQGRYAESLNLIRSRVPFPGILGYVCFHPCENSCRRQYIDESVAICSLKRFVADKIPLDDIVLPQIRPDTGKKVAIIGSGPAGLTAAYYLRLAGHDVEVFDNANKPGGMLSHGIPDYRLPPEILERELKSLKELGIKFQMGRSIGDDFGIPDLKAAGFDVILAAAGTPDSKLLNIENSQLEGIFPGLEFLKSAKLSREPVLDGKVVVIGGGNVAIDAAMTALRLGAKDVKLVCLESREEMPAHDWEIDQAAEENIEIINSWGPKRFIAGDNRVSAIEFKKCVRVFDEQGKFSPQYDENETMSLPADYVIVTIGQDVDRNLVNHLGKLRQKPGEPIKPDKNHGIGIDGVFVAGDIARGPSSVVEAIAEGRNAAKAIDIYLGGDGLIDETINTAEYDDLKLSSSAESIKQSRHVALPITPEERKTKFCLIEETLDEQSARAEADRCLKCHLRQLISPVVLPPAKWLTFDRESVNTVPDTEGVFQLLDDDKKTFKIAGTPNLRQALKESLENQTKAKFFIYEEDSMYTKRESELIQLHLQKHGELPGGGMGDDLDDLF